MLEKKNIKLTKTINQCLLFRDSSYKLSANRFKAYHLLQEWYLLFRSSFYMLLANKFRVYHLSKRILAVCSDLLILLFLVKNILSFKKNTRSILFTLTYLYLTKFSKKVGKIAYPHQKISIVYSFQIWLTQQIAITCFV